MDVYPGKNGDSSTGGRQGTKVIVGKSGDWVVVNEETGKVIQVNDRHNKKQKPPEKKEAKKETKKPDNNKAEDRKDREK